MCDSAKLSEPMFMNSSLRGAIQRNCYLDFFGNDKLLSVTCSESDEAAEVGSSESSNERDILNVAVKI